MGPNPFIAQVLAGWTLARPFEVHGSRCLLAIFEIIAQVEDPRAGETLKDALARGEWNARQRTGLERLITQSAHWRVREAVPRAALEGLESPVRPKLDTTELFGMVYDAPGDLDRRRVLADALSEEGDARGEFISLQLNRRTARPGPREKALLFQYGNAWLGPLAGLFRSFSFEGGFLAGGVLNGRENGGSLFNLLAAAEPSPLALVEFDGSLGGGWDFAALDQAAPSLPALEALSLQGGWGDELRPADLARFIMTPLGRQLRRLSMKIRALTTYDEGVALHDLLTLVLSTGRGVFEVTTGDVRIELDASAQHAKVHFDSPPPAPLFLPAFRMVELSGDEGGVQRFRSRIVAQGQAVRFLGTE